MKKIVSILFTSVFCLLLCFNNFALDNVNLNSVSRSKEQASSGAYYYIFNNGNYSSISNNCNNSTMRIYYISDSKATLVVYKVKNGKESKLKTINLAKGKNSYSDVNIGNSPISNMGVTYKIKLTKGNNVKVAVSVFDMLDKSINLHNKYK